MIATNNPSNRIPWPKPDNYDPKRYELLLLMLQGMEKKLGRPQVFNEVSLNALIPNQKADFNNNGAFSTDYIGKSYDYPEASHAQRREIWKDHENYQKGYYYFLANDPRVPATLQQEVREWGLPKDEYEDTGHWPNQLYVSEARRMTGEFVVTQKDLQTERTKTDVIGMGSYNSDSHNVQRYVNERGFVENEGDMQVAVQPYQIPYRVMLPTASRGDEPAGAGLLFGEPCGLLFAAHGAAIYDPRACGGCCRTTRGAERKGAAGCGCSGVAEDPEAAGGCFRVCSVSPTGIVEHPAANVSAAVAGKVQLGVEALRSHT